MRFVGKFVLEIQIFTYSHCQNLINGVKLFIKNTNSIHLNQNKY